MGYEILIVLISGLTVGSFLNMLIYRLPLGISLFNPKRSECTKCQYTIKWYENIPLISYLFLKGKCSNCKTNISLIYPLVEIITAFVSLLLYLKIGFSSEFYLLSIIFYLLILLSFIDLEYKAVPDYLLVLISIFILSYLYIYNQQNFSTYFMFAGGIFIIDLFVSFYIQNIKAFILKDNSLKEQKALGEGDIPIIALIGGLLGLKFGMVAVFLSAILAIIPSIINMILKKEIETAFIPYLSLGLFITYINDSKIQEFLEGLNLI